MWQDHPWIGVGPAHFDYRFRAYRPPKLLRAGPARPRPQRLPQHPRRLGRHRGPPRRRAWALFWWGVFRSWKFVQRAQNDLSAKRSNRSAFVLGGSLGLLAILVHSFVDFNMHVPANAILAVTLWPGRGHFRFATEGYWHTVRWPLRIPLMTLLATSYVLAYATWHRTHELRWLVAAENLRPASAAQTAAYEKAFALRPSNFEAAYNIAENYRAHAWQGLEGHQNLTYNAMQWFQRAMHLNPYDPYPPMRYAMCLHWLGNHDEALPYFQRALKLDPNSYYTRAHMGWHYAQRGDWPKFREWMDESLKMKSDPGNVVAWSYTFLAGRANRRGRKP